MGNRTDMTIAIAITQWHRSFGIFEYSSGQTLIFKYGFSGIFNLNNKKSLFFSCSRAKNN